MELAGGSRWPLPSSCSARSRVAGMPPHPRTRRSCRRTNWVSPAGPGTSANPRPGSRAASVRPRRWQPPRPGGLAAALVRRGATSWSTRCRAPRATMARRSTSAGGAATAGCTVRDATFGARVYLVFGNDSWTFVAMLVPPGDGSAEQVTFLLELRDRQLAAAGGEPRTVDPVSTEATALDRYMPAEVPGGLSPPGGIVADFDSLGRLTDEEMTLPQSDWDFLMRRVSTRARLWMGPGGYYLAVIVTEFPYEVLAGLALGTLEGSTYRPIAADARRSIDDLLAVDATPADQSARHRSWSWRSAVGAWSSGSPRRDPISRRASSWHRRSPRTFTGSLRPAARRHHSTRRAHSSASGKRSSRRPSSDAAALLLRRLLAGRARPVTPLRPPTPVVTDVGDRAAALRRSGRRLAAEQIGGLRRDRRRACRRHRVVVDRRGRMRVADWRSGDGPARRRELERTAHRWSVGSWRAVAIGTVSATLLVVGVALAVRALKESVLLPSLTHLRLSERFGVSPSRLGAVMAIVGVGSLVLGALLLRRAHAHARTARVGSTGRAPADPLPALLRRRRALRPERPLGETTVLRAVQPARARPVRGGHRLGTRRPRTRQTRSAGPVGRSSHSARPASCSTPRRGRRPWPSGWRRRDGSRSPSAPPTVSRGSSAS